MNEKVKEIIKNTFDNTLLASIYDFDNPDGSDHDFYRQLANDIYAQSIINLGCGTGVLTTTLAVQERNVLGIDPASAMLEVARNHQNSDEVAWIGGDCDKIFPDSADLIIMTGNVAMHILGNDWYKTLQYIAYGLKYGGTVAFETRNPKAQAWKNWHQENELRDTPAGKIRETTLTDPPDDQGIVTMHNLSAFRLTANHSPCLKNLRNSATSAEDWVMATEYFAPLLMPGS